VVLSKAANLSVVLKDLVDKAREQAVHRVDSSSKAASREWVVSKMLVVHSKVANHSAVLKDWADKARVPADLRAASSSREWVEARAVLRDCRVETRAVAEVPVQVTQTVKTVI
jgi:hypothetical protein